MSVYIHLNLIYFPEYNLKYKCRAIMYTESEKHPILPRNQILTVNLPHAYCQAQSQLKHSWTELALLSTYTQYGLGYIQHGLGYMQYGLGYIP